MNTPWVAQYDSGFKASLDYPDLNLYETLVRTAELFPNKTALAFEGNHISYRDLLRITDCLAKRLRDSGLKKGDVFTICLPNIPHATAFFYAVNKIGCIANMLHPKTPPFELRECMIFSESRFLVILDAFFPKHVDFLDDDFLEKVYIAAIPDFLSGLKGFGFKLTKGRKIPAVQPHKKLITWKNLMQNMQNETIPTYKRQIEAHEPAVYLHSGGTTSAPKTVVLSSMNMNVIAAQGPQIVNIENPLITKKASDEKMLSILPLFHGFGLCMGLHAMIYSGLTAVLVPLFNADALAAALLKERVSMIAAVPTLYEGFINNKKISKANLSHLRCCFCGGDTLSQDLKQRFEIFVKDRGAPIPLREGYGLTETVTVCAVNPQEKCRSGSIGLPLADVHMKVVRPDSEQEVPVGENGEICVSGLTCMLGYLKDEAATAHTMRVHEDGKTWVHTGDMGAVDEDGFFYFVQRIKRVVKVSGIPVFPSRIEDVISEVDGVRMACAIPVKDDYRVHVIKAFVVAEENINRKDYDKLEQQIRLQCEKKLIPYARPVIIEFKDGLPLTLVGKIDFMKLELQENVAEL